jgi:hypothetical protein
MIQFESNSANLGDPWKRSGVEVDGHPPGIYWRDVSELGRAYLAGPWRRLRS